MVNNRNCKLNDVSVARSVNLARRIDVFSATCPVLSAESSPDEVVNLR